MNQELELFRDNVSRFIETEILTQYEQWESDEIFPRELWSKLGEQGLLAVDIPETYGGFETDFLFSMIIQEELSKNNCAALAASVLVHSDIVAHYILNNGSDDQKHKYLSKMVSGECIGAVAMTEPNAGSDLQAIRTSAKKSGDGYILNGSKTFITNGQHCDVVIVAARTNMDVSASKGTTLFLVDSSTKGFERGRNLEKIGLHSSDTSELFFNEIYLPETSMLGELDKGFTILMKELGRERLGLAIGSVAASEGMLEETISYVKERQAFGKTIADFQATKFKLAEMATEIRVNRSFVDDCKRLFIQEDLDVATVSMAKLSATEMQSKIADGCLQLFGGYGYMREYGISRSFVDSRVQRIYGGTSEIMKELISRYVLS